MPHVGRRLLALSMIVLSFAVAAEPRESGVRVFNPGTSAAEATIECNGVARPIAIEAGAVHDWAAADGCDGETLHSRAPLLALATGDDGAESQRAIGPTAASCGVTTMSIPLFACKLGTATVSVPPANGATYEWAVQGATIADGAGSHRVTLALGSEATVRVSALVTSGDCTKSAAGVIALREPLVIRELVAPAAAEASQPMTLTWSYEPGSEPVSQTLSSDSFSAPVALAASARSYTFTPGNGGTHTYELRASYAPALRAPKAAGRRRSVGSALVSAVCPAARAAVTVQVSGCTVARPEIDAPNDVDAGDTFTASIGAEHANDSVVWTAENATLTANTGREVQVRAGSSGNIKLTVRVERAAGCTSTNSLAVPIRPGACPARPAAVVSYVSHDCDSATITATFTGVPPFRGTWFDGKRFSTRETTLTREVTQPGLYTITEFADASCSGSVTSFELPSFRPRAKVTLTGSACANSKAKLTAKLTGVPPFRGTWSDGEEFTTDTYETQRTAPRDGTFFIANVGDAVCSGDAASNRVEVRPVPVATLYPGPYCQYYTGDPASVYVRFDPQTTQGPYVVDWEDGVRSVSQSADVIRSVSTTQLALALRVTRAQTGQCEATVPVATTTVAYRRAVVINTTYTTGLTCIGKTGVSELANGVPPGATIEWKVAGGEIVSGQGTGAVTFRALTSGKPLLVATAKYPDGACSTFDHAPLSFMREPSITDFRVSSPTIKARGKTTLQFSVDNGESYAIVVTPSSRRGDLGQLSCTDSACSATFTDSHGAGTVSFELQYANSCTSMYKTATTTVTVVP